MARFCWSDESRFMPRNRFLRHYSGPHSLGFSLLELLLQMRRLLKAILKLSVSFMFKNTLVQKQSIFGSAARRREECAERNVIGAAPVI